MKSAGGRRDEESRELQLTGKSLLQKVGSLRRSVGEERGERLLLPEGESSEETQTRNRRQPASSSRPLRGTRNSPDVVSRPSAVDGVELVEDRGSENVEDEGELVVVVSSREDGFA